MTNDEIRMKCEARNPKVAAAAPAGSRSAELHSAVSQSCTLLRAGESGGTGRLPHLAAYNSTVQKIENVRYEDTRSPHHALLHFQASGVSHNRAFAGLLVT